MILIMRRLMAAERNSSNGRKVRRWIVLAVGAGARSALWRGPKVTELSIVMFVASFRAVVDGRVVAELVDAEHDPPGTVGDAHRATARESRRSTSAASAVASSCHPTVDVAGEARSRASDFVEHAAEHPVH